MSEPRVVKLGDLAPAQREVVLALVRAGESARERRTEEMVAVAERTKSENSEFSPRYAGHVSASVEWVGPPEAERLLARNFRNRRLKDRLIQQIEDDLQSDNFDLNGESIKVSRTGTLLDGQNRLTAVVRSGKGAWMVVVRGLEDRVQETVDIGVQRKLGDALTIRGEPSATVLASALLYAWKLQFNGHLGTGQGYRYPSHAELIEYLADNPNIRESVRRADALRKSGLRYSSSLGGALHYMMSHKDPEQADEFWTMLKDGAGLSAGDPILVLRNNLVRDMGSPRKMDEVQRAAITIKAWNAVRRNKVIRLITWRRSGPQAEEFPTIE